MARNSNPFLSDACRAGRGSARNRRWQLPRNTSVSPSPLLAHYLPDYWTQPERFDPERFSAPRAEHRKHSHCYLPFGGGAHTCISMHFARPQVRAIVYQLLRRFELRLPPNYRLDMQAIPIAKPRGGLPLILTPRAS